MNKGQSLFEVVVAIAISALVIGAIVSLATNSIRNATFSKNQSLAADYAQEVTEWLRGQRDSDITGFITHASQPGKWCFFNLDWSENTACTLDQKIGGTFTREATFTITAPGGKTIVEADVMVSWNDSSGTHQFTSATSYSDWRQR